MKKYDVSGTDKYRKYLVNGVSQLNNIRGTNISMDCYLTSVTVSDWANQKDVTVVGTMRLDFIGLPKRIKEVNGREEKATLYMHSKDKNMILVSYIDKSW